MSTFKVFFDWHLNDRLGGPPGYLANLRNGLKDNSLDSLIDFVVNEEPYFQAEKYYPKGVVGQVIKFLDKHPAGQKLLFNKHLNTNRRKDAISFIEYLENFNSIYLSDEQKNRVNFGSSMFVHAHTTIDAVKLINTVRVNGYQTKVILTSHCPEAPSNEWAEKFRVDGLPDALVERLRKAYAKVDEFAFRNVDRLIFPSEESVEPYLQDIEYFQEILNNKKISYLHTGCKPLEPSRNRRDICASLNIPENAFVIGYMGRHNKIKGYDVLIEIAKNILEKYPNVYFVVGGSAGQIEPLGHNRWIELGWTNEPANYINCFDLFLLPNRQTYFDLISLEVLSLNVPVLASNTGGNKTIAKLCDDYTLYDTLDEAIKKVELVINNQKVECSSQAAYDKYFSLDIFAKQYSDLARSLLKEEIYNSRYLRVSDDKELVSIVVPIYNVENYLYDCLLSIAFQSYQNIEVILVDDGSTDRSSKIAQSFSEIDARFIYKRKDNGGLSSARNFGLKFVNGDYVVLIDSDDYCDHQMVEKLLEVITKENTDLAICAINFDYTQSNMSKHSGIHGNENADSQNIICSKDNDLLVDLFPSAWNKMYRTKLMENLTYIEGIYYEDHDFFWNYLERCNEITYINESLYTQRLNRPGQITSISSNKIFDIFKVLDVLSENWYFTKNKENYQKLAIRLLWERYFCLGEDLYDEFISRSNEIFNNVDIEQLLLVKDPFIPTYVVELLSGKSSDSKLVIALESYSKENLDKLSEQLVKDFKFSGVGLSLAERKKLEDRNYSVVNSAADFTLTSTDLSWDHYLYSLLK